MSTRDDYEDVPPEDRRDDVVYEDEPVRDDPPRREAYEDDVRRHDPPRREAREDDVRRERRDERVVERTAPAGGVREARRWFGGLDLPASLVGMLTALAMLLLLAGLVGAAIGTVGWQMGVEGRDLSIAGLVGGLIVLLLAYLVGGWTAGRIARYDGALNGAMTGVWTLVLAAILGALGAWVGTEYDVLARVELPQWFSRDALTIGGIVSGIIAIAAMLGGGALGGASGERYHRRVDAAIVGDVEGPPPPA